MNKTALLVVDMVNDFASEGGKVYYPVYEEIIPNIKKATELFHDNQMPVLFFQHRYRRGKYDRNLESHRPCCIQGSGGEEIIAELDVFEQDYVIEKRRYSGFHGTDLDLILRENGIENAVIVGIKTNNCVYATALDASYRNYNVFVLTDCVSTDDRRVHEVFIGDIGKYLGSCLTLNEARAKVESGEWK